MKKQIPINLPKTGGGGKISPTIPAHYGWAGWTDFLKPPVLHIAIMTINDKANPD